MFKWLRQFGTRKAANNNGQPPVVRVIRGRYDSAQTTDENRRHWNNADHLSANATASAEVRRVLRSRARYEVANNSYAKGIVLTLANYVVGTGPRLQMLTDDPDANRVIEKEFTRWAKAIGLAHKLRTMRIAQCETGEVFGILATNPGIDTPVQLDVRLIEADQVATPWPVGPRGRGPSVAADTEPFGSSNAAIDGILLDSYGKPPGVHVFAR